MRQWQSTLFGSRSTKKNWEDEYGDEDEDKLFDLDFEKDEGADEDSKRKAPAPPPGKDSTKSKTTPMRRTYEVALRGKDDSGQLLDAWHYQLGTIKFWSERFSRFTCDVEIPGVGNGHPWFTGGKVSDTPDSYRKEWDRYTDEALEREEWEMRMNASQGWR
ncbi:uncharacterized protein N7483_011746 [Penicillium malachiteum]|uniref:uncharacterized protein n=1 Tax=Penicillium malachiteum TaxID=1324776 RepID=UPI002547BC6E|nr:uncharacterized protein N7483_011746 [Penicillium malachiteum]KAJ5714565.1 hypothetical protein N7483_011746 [Penicillium malachiteum]